MKMKYMAVLATIVANLLLQTGCDEIRIRYARLPSAARSFIETYFIGEKCVYAELDWDDGRREYKAVLSNGAEIDFDRSGLWETVDCKYSFLPAGIIPDKIMADISVRYPGSGIYKVERALGGYEVHIGNGIELIYSSDGRFVRIDM